MEIQSIKFNPRKNANKNSCWRIVLSYENIAILIKYPKAFDKKYVWIPNINIPTILLKKPKYFAPITPNEDLRRTTKGKPNFCEGLPIKFENK